MAAQSYSFIDIQGTLASPFGVFTLGTGAAEEGFTISQSDDKVTQTMGADGSGMYSLHAARNGLVTVSLLKVSPVNQQLMDVYNIETSSAANLGGDTLTFGDPNRGDFIVASQCAFRKVPDILYAKDGGLHQWIFFANYIAYRLGNGSPSAF